ncbi:16S rRNA (cytosine967-C5)-methyltransferase [Sulfitobacter marinus]|uniref:16S rRNA (Cytosine967-C5)-methyltransferase n=1 Tax=Sulfitobacter marinus TaxID=394264 RepID=A0A1I6QAW8_9RHOB|nr:RsmB/NOP family class I SAM-dependent RNA methyltransferase [Sulfitobacter marinus]SFS49606.1 16S rRNA (cytosine967-C5)-methyltransferase [Sulfitobacter marinus]
MTPGARVAAAIEILNTMSDGLPAEQALTRWGRGNRFAGSKDRAAIRDHVFDVLRQRRTAAHLGGGETGRALMIGILRAQHADINGLLNGVGHAPQPLTEAEQPLSVAAEEAVHWNLPDWIIPQFKASLQDRVEAVALALQARAPITLRVNMAKTTPQAAAVALAEQGIETRANPLADTALTVTAGERKIRNSDSYLQGMVELQDASSQAVVAAIPPAGRVLDYCAGGGGKSLALAAGPATETAAHDIDPRRMQDLPTRAARAGSSIRQIETDNLRNEAPFDVVLCDAPCSGSGAWRRSPEGKWTLSATRLEELTQVQDSILDAAIPLTAANGCLVYATCSILACENEDRINAFLQRHPDWSVGFQKRFDTNDDGDGFFTAHLRRN